MSNKKVIISLLAIAMAFGLFFVGSSKEDKNALEFSVSTLDLATTDGSEITLEDTQVVEVYEPETPLATIGKTDSSEVRNLNSSELEVIRNNLIAAVNKERSKDVKEYSKLETTGNIRAKEIVEKWSHTRPNGKDWSTVLASNGISTTNLKAGEDLAKVSGTAKASYTEDYLTKLSNTIHDSLMNSATHKKVILNDDYHEIGVGVYSEVKDGKVTVYVTEHFKNETVAATAKKAVSKLTIKDVPTSKTYTGKQIKPSITVYDGSKKLTNNTDYTVSYGTNKSVGNGTIKITGKGNYTGSVTKTFTIKKISASSLTIKDVPTTKTYTGKQIKPSITVYDGSKKLTNKTDYTVSYGTNKSTGKATIKITGKGNYTGSVTKTFYIVPAKVTLSSVTAGSKKATVKFKKVTGATGYQIAYKKDGASSWSTTTTTSTSKAISKLTKGKKYTFKVRAYKTVSGVKKYGSYSSTKTVKIK